MDHTYPHTSDGQLRQAFSLTEEDLAANHDGYMTPLQQGRLRRKRTLYTLGMLGAIVLCVILGISGLATGGKSQGRYNPYLGGVGLLCFGVPLLFVGIYWAQRIAADAHNNDVKSLTGTISRRDSTKGVWKSYKVVLQGEVFDINSAQYQALIEGERYTLYYTPLSKQLVSAEPAP